MLDARQAREAVHVLLLRRLLDVRRGEAVTVKGGVTLRLFYGSPRYSEDIDLDGNPDARLALRDAVIGFFDNEAVMRELRRLGLRGLDPKEGPNKDTRTTFRHKFHVLAPGGMNYPTKVELSFRGPHTADTRRVTAPDREILDRYFEDRVEFKVPHYTLPSAVRQKIEALAERRQVQARDVFDLDVLTKAGHREDDELIDYLAEHLSAAQLDEAYRRVFVLDYGDYEGQVVEFLGADDQDRYRNREVWQELQLKIGYLIEAIQKQQGESS